MAKYEDNLLEKVNLSQGQKEAIEEATGEIEYLDEDYGSELLQINLNKAKASHERELQSITGLQKVRSRAQHRPEDTWDAYEDRPVRGRKSKETEKKPRQKAKKQKHRGTGVFLLVPGLLVLLVLFGLYGCKTETLKISGSTCYNEEELEGMLREPQYTDNSLYFWFYYKNLYKGEIPFVESVEVHFDSPTTLRVEIKEKDIVGYLVYADSYLFFNRKGIIVENSGIRLSGIPRLDGYDFSVLEVGDKLPVEDQTLLQQLMTACKEVKRTEIPVTSVSADQKGDINLTAGQIRISLGQGVHLEDKISLANVLLEKLDERSGILHLEDYDGTNGTRSFQADENDPLTQESQSEE